ncbi:MAG TPA: DUF1080 domain-containing protein [Bryobacteraceae bacterium]|jgi:hypothetical protein
MSITTRLAAALVFAALLAAQQHAPVGYTDTPYLPDGKWRVHDLNRPHPKKVTPGTNGSAPSDALVLFDGTNLDHWTGLRGDKVSPPSWKLENGYIEVVPGTTDLSTKEKFGDMQLHIEWASPEKIEGESQDRGNSGVIIQGRYEVQVLDSYTNVTYADGQAGAIYGQYPPLVNASRKPGEWQTYDIVWEAPKFENGKLLSPGYLTLFHNGVLLHNRKAYIGTVVHRQVAHYTPHDAEEPLVLQNHGTKVRFRNIWVRKIGTYDQP